MLKFSSVQGRNHGWIVEGDQGLGPNTGALGAEGVAPVRCEGPGYHPRKIFENSDAKSCILVTTCCEISCFLKTTVKKLGDQQCVSLSGVSQLL